MNIAEFLHFVFGLPYAWTYFPKIIWYWILPEFFLIITFYILLNKGMGTMSPPANIALSIILGLLCSRIAVGIVARFGLVGGNVILLSAFFGLCAISYGWSIKAIFTLLAIGFYIGWFLELVTLEAMAGFFGFFIAVAVIGRFIGITTTGTVLFIIAVSIIALLLPYIFRFTITSIKSYLKI